MSNSYEVVTIWGNFILSIKNKNEIIFFKKKIIKNKKEYANWEEKKKWGVVWDSSLEFIIIQEGFQPHFLKTPL